MIVEITFLLQNPHPMPSTNLPLASPIMYCEWSLKTHFCGLIREDLIYSVIVVDAMIYNNETCAIKIKMLFLLMTMY